jgi:apolipoprotein N-acyltransferase
MAGALALESGEEMRIDFSGGAINIVVEQTVGHSTTITTYVVSWPVWGTVLMLFLVLCWTALRKRERAD